MWRLCGDSGGGILFFGCCCFSTKQLICLLFKAYLLHLHIFNLFQILCSSNPGTLKWLQVTDGEFRQQTQNKTFVIGGYENDFDLYIGRTVYEGEIYSGKIDSNNTFYGETVPMFFVYNNRELQASKYEVLVTDE